MNDFSTLDFGKIRQQAQEYKEKQKIEEKKRYERDRLNARCKFRLDLSEKIKLNCSNDEYGPIELNFPGILSKEDMLSLMNELSEQGARLTYSYYKNNGIVSGKRETTYNGSDIDKSEINKSTEVKLYFV